MQFKAVLYLGMSTPRGTVREEQLEAFFKREVDPIWKGFTYQIAWGSWKGVRERTCLLTYLGDHHRQLSFEAHAIGVAYCRRFDQETVIMEVSTMNAQFVSAPEPEPLWTAAEPFGANADKARLAMKAEASFISADLPKSIAVKHEPTPPQPCFECNGSAAATRYRGDGED